MLRALLLIVASSFSVVLHATEAAPATQATPATEAASPAKATETAGADGPPSCEASRIPGALGTFPLTPPDWRQGETTFWIDSDGVDPGTAGCHVGATDRGQPNGRKFGEFCQSNTVLVESNPSAAKLHLHQNDTGHPDRFDCMQWCNRTGRGNGRCETVPAGPAPCEQSARCRCDA